MRSFVPGHTCFAARSPSEAGRGLAGWAGKQMTKDESCLQFFFLLQVIGMDLLYSKRAEDVHGLIVVTTS